MTKYYFFSGKGGVGKTSSACATAVYYATQGKKTLLITTDPASNLGDVFYQEIGHKVTPIQEIEHLWAMEIDPAKATEEYRDRALAPLREVLPAEILDVVAEQLNSPCTEEVASFDRFVDFLNDNEGFEIVIFDTAPTGHTLRMLELPVDWKKHIEEAETGSGQTCMGPVQLLQGAKERYQRAMDVMRDSDQTTFVFVAQPEATPLGETKRSLEELHRLDIYPQQLIINGMIPADQEVSSLFQERKALQQRYIRQVEEEGAFSVIKKVPLLPFEIRGKQALEKLGAILYENDTEMSLISTDQEKKELPAPFMGDTGSEEVIALLRRNEKQRIVLFAGKGGVGKTSMAAVAAVQAAQQGEKTLLVTTDPASHLSQLLEQEIDHTIHEVAGVPGLFATRIHPKKAVEEYREQILSDAREKYTEEMVGVLEEQLDSPCTEEMACFHVFLRYMVDLEDEYDVIVFDTAPTGHTLRLLELPIHWNEEMEKKEKRSALSGEEFFMKEKFQKAMAKLRDTEQTTMAFVVYPEGTPIIEAERAVQELETVDIYTTLVVANLVLPKEECTTPYLQTRYKLQQAHLRMLPEKFKAKIAIQSLLPHEISGVEVLKRVARHLYEGKGES
jgi:arsenite-transporting ATPase